MKIENIVASGTFKQNLDLLKLSQAGLIEYDPEMYHGGYIKTNGHSVTLYRTGKYILPGMNSVEDLSTTFSNVKEILADHVDLSVIEEPKIKNLVCSSNLGRSLDLQKTFINMLNLDFNASYEPESFPGLIFRAERCTYNLFASGKFLILGCNDIQVAEECELYLIAMLGDVII